MSTNARIILLLCLDLNQSQAIKLIKFARETAILDFNIADVFLVGLGDKPHD